MQASWLRKVPSEDVPRPSLAKRGALAQVSYANGAVRPGSSRRRGRNRGAIRRERAAGGVPSAPEIRTIRTLAWARAAFLRRPSRAAPPRPSTSRSFLRADRQPRAPGAPSPRTTDGRRCGRWSARFSQLSAGRAASRPRCAGNAIAGRGEQPRLNRPSLRLARCVFLRMRRSGSVNRRDGSWFKRLSLRATTILR